MHKILVNGIQLYAYHGCMEEEGKVGRSFKVDIEIDADLTKPASTDKISDTINYVTVYEIVKQEMAIRSHLIEHVAGRILNELKRTFPAIKQSTVKVTKLHPPIQGTVESTSVIISG